MLRRHGHAAALLVLLVLAALAVPAYSALAGGHGSVRTVDITIHYSHFSPSTVTVAAGSTVRFRVTNADPIDHELIVGDQTLQDREQAGTDPIHDGSVPGMISVPAGTTVATVYTFPRHAHGGNPLSYACHLPGHYAYGMRGAIHLTP